MPYVERRDGVIVGVYAKPQPGYAVESVKEGSPELAAYFRPQLSDISDRQFAQQLAILGTITEGEAIAWASRGDLPAALEQAIATLPEAGGVQFAARMLLSSATTYERSHPMTDTLGAILGYDAAALDALWRDAAAL